MCSNNQKKYSAEKFITELLLNKKINLKKCVKKVNFDELIKVSSKHYIIPLLYVKLIQKDLIKYIDDKNFIVFIKKIYDLNVKNNKKLIDECNELSFFLKKNGIKFLFLKGSAHVISGLYDDIGERMVSDIDILLDSNDCERAYKLLLKEKFIKSESSLYSFRKAIHKVPIKKKENQFYIELHFNLLKKNKDAINEEYFLNNSIKVNEMLVPTLFNQLTHNIYNHQINDDGNYKLTYNYRNIYDTLQLTNKYKLNFSRLKNDKYVKNYFNILKILGIRIQGDNIFKKKNVINFRFNLKKRNPFFRMFDDFFVDWLYNNFDVRLMQVYNLIFNKEFRSFVYKNLYKYFSR